MPPDAPNADGFAADTRLADAIAREPAVADRLAAFHRAFEALRGGRAALGRRATFADAARIAGVPVETVLAVAAGRPVPEAGEAAAPDAGAPAPEWAAGIDPATAERIDVRPILADDRDPLAEVLRRASGIAEGGALIVEAPFDPVPLRRVLARRGFSSWSERLGPDHWRVRCRRDGRGEVVGAADEPERGPTDARIWREDDGIHVDVRGLAPPGPMIAIVELIERPETTGPVIVHHDREPIYLYPELAERGWRHEIVPGEAGEVRLRLSPPAEDGEPGRRRP